MSAIESAISQHASTNTVMHCLYGYYFLGIKRPQLAVLYGKSEQTISNWVHKYEETGGYVRKSSAPERTFTTCEKEWLIGHFKRHPLSFLDEAKYAFTAHFNKFISISTIWKVIHDTQDVCRFVVELDSILWSQRNVVFLDEVSFDNRGMLRRRGYAMKGEKVVVRGELGRQASGVIVVFLECRRLGGLFRCAWYI
ncbi:hypothetical protein AeRB84_020087 [Aphanomyces euteiches]|nr:hypothetical protein AeRB84_020087 [Aphanomyces euteiches]